MPYFIALNPGWFKVSVLMAKPIQSAGLYYLHTYNSENVFYCTNERYRDLVFSVLI